MFKTSTGLNRLEDIDQYKEYIKANTRPTGSTFATFMSIGFLLIALAATVYYALRYADAKKTHMSYADGVRRKLNTAILADAVFGGFVLFGIFMMFQNGAIRIG